MHMKEFNSPLSPATSRQMTPRYLFISLRLMSAIKNSGYRYSSVSQRLNINSTIFSLLLNRRLCVRPNDPRVLRMASFFNVQPNEAFEEVHTAEQNIVLSKVNEA